MTRLAAQPEGSSLLNREICEELNLPKAFMHKIMKQLVDAGLLESARGKRGGFKLKRKPADISIFDISRLFDNLDIRENCVLGQDTCSDDTPCPLHKAWKAIMRDFLTAIKGMTLEDMARFGLDPHRAYPVNMPEPELLRLAMERRKACADKDAACGGAPPPDAGAPAE